MSIALFVIAGVMALGELVRIRQVGRPRSPLTAREAAVSATISAVVIVVLVIAALRYNA